MQAKPKGYGSMAAVMPEPVPQRQESTATQLENLLDREQSSADGARLFSQVPTAALFHGQPYVQLRYGLDLA